MTTDRHARGNSPPSPTALVDVHCHILPGIDDGATDWQTTLAMARAAAADGISLVVATPHQLGSYRNNTAETIRSLVTEANRRLEDAGIPLVIRPGADVRIDDDLPERVADDSVMTLADRGRHVLLELPHELYVPLEGLLDRLERMGLVGILSHPERNAGIQRDPRIVDRLVARGCLMQLTAGSLTGSFGEPIQRLSEVLLKRGVIHMVASDAHGLRRRRPILSRAYRRTHQLIGPRAADVLFRENPTRIAQGEDVILELPKTTSFWGSFWKRRAG
ncbi:exopolysaccharide biosynthesis protein [Thermostilla marina]